MKFQQENALMAMSFNECLKHGGLVLEIILLAEETSKATILIVDQAHGCAFSTELVDIETSFFENVLRTLWSTIWKCHFLWLAAVFCDGVCLWNYGITLVSLFPTI